MTISNEILGFEADTKIVHIGNLFRGQNQQRWLINIWGNPIQDKKHLSFSLMPLLARSRLINRTGLEKNQLRNESIKFTKHISIVPVTLEECSVLSSQPKSIQSVEKNQWAFKFIQPDGLTVYLPQLELARVLFLTSSYLSRAALSTTYLKNDFDINIDAASNAAFIHIIGTTSFPMRAFNYTSVRQMIAWILLDPNARNSFTSISKNLLTECENVYNWQRWAFHFTPPNLEKWQISYKGIFDPKNNNFMVHEITRLSILPNMPTFVEFINPAFTEQKITLLSNNAMKSVSQQRSDDIVIDDDKTAVNAGVNPPLFAAD